MKKSFKLWFNLFASPSEGFKQLTAETPIAFPLVFAILLLLAGFILLVPIMGSEAYTDALSRIQLHTLEQKGQTLSDEQIELMQEQLKSPRMKTITIIGSTIGGVGGYFISLLATVVILLLLTMIFKEKSGFKLLFKMLIFLSIISAIQLIVKNGISLLSDYQRLLSRAESAFDLQLAMSSPVSLASLFQPGGMNNALYLFIDQITDVFNWLHFIYLYLGLRFAAGIMKEKAISISIIIALFSVCMGLLPTLLIK